MRHIALQDQHSADRETFVSEHLAHHPLEYSSLLLARSQAETSQMADLADCHSLCKRLVFHPVVAASLGEVRYRGYFLFVCAGFIVLGLVGGSDTSRIIFTGNVLVIGATLIPTNDRLVPTWHVFMVFILSGVVALTYVNLLPSTLEYDYYMQRKRLRPTLTVLAGAALFWLIAAYVTRRRPPQFDPPHLVIREAA